MSAPAAGGWVTRDAHETEALAARLLGVAPPPGSPRRLIELAGDLGTGKSTFARGALRALGATGPIKSPSYTLIEVYDLPGVLAVHLDLYRLNDPGEIEYLGLGEYDRPGTLWLVEWPEKAAGRLPPPQERFEFAIDDAGHRIQRIETFSPTK